MTEDASDNSPPPRRKVHVLGRAIHLPHSKPLRITIGSSLIVLGTFGFLPVLGFWMIPLGALVLSQDVAWARRRRRRMSVWWEKRRRRKGGPQG
ncbi:hypothetical protein ABUE31_18500 [Mesorhizobium sp. ZMM04-5]|uniref:Transmembrane protein (PGPGW) n=1 Tax=Mesorhizobium marinum TaxID=3228790 RepID=A0ABV3R496_9HYPH